MAIPFVRQFDDIAEAMADPNPNRPATEAVAKFGRQVCDAISARPGTFAPTILQSPLRWACKPYWDSQGRDGPDEVPPFSGGQCPKLYRVRGEWRTTSFLNCSTGFSGGADSTWTFFATEFDVQGPISGFTLDRINPSQCGGFDGHVIFAQTPGGPQAVNQRFGTGIVRREVEFRIIGLDAADGVDNCGDPPPELVPGPNPSPDPGPLPPGTGPSFDIRGNPILVLPPTLVVAPGINLELAPGEFYFGGGNGNNSAVEPFAGDAANGEGSGNGGGDNDFGDPPEGERWVGCCVTVTQRPVGHGSIPQSEPETIFPDIIGNVRLRFNSASQVPEYDTPLTNKSKTLCVWEPVRGMNPTGVRVNLRPGFEYSYRPYSVPDSN